MKSRKGNFNGNLHFELEEAADDLFSLIKAKVRLFPDTPEKEDYNALLGDLDETIQGLVSADQAVGKKQNRELKDEQKTAYRNLKDLLSQIGLIPSGDANNARESDEEEKPAPKPKAVDDVSSSPKRLSITMPNIPIMKGRTPSIAAPQDEKSIFAALVKALDASLTSVGLTAPCTTSFVLRPNLLYLGLSM